MAKVCELTIIPVMVYPLHPSLRRSPGLCLAQVCQAAILLQGIHRLQRSRQVGESMPFKNAVDSAFLSLSLETFDHGTGQAVGRSTGVQQR